MAKTSKKKTPAKTTSTRKTAKKSPARSVKKTPKKKAASVKKKATPAKKKPAKTTKAAAGKPAAKAVAKKAASKKSAPGKAAAKKVARKSTAGTASAKKKTAAKKAPAKKPAVKKAEAKPVKKKKTSITVIEKKPVKKTPAPPTAAPRKRKNPRKPAGPVHGMRAAGSVHVNGNSIELPDEELTHNQLKRAKSGLKRADLQFFRNELLERRAEILGDVEGLDAARNSLGGDSSSVPLHMADVGSENYDREFNLGLLETEKKLLREIDFALLRIADKTYGICHATGKPIERIRLEIKPWAKYCIEVARERERRGLPT